MARGMNPFTGNGLLPPETSKRLQLSRIEAKLDRVLELLDPPPPEPTGLTARLCPKCGANWKEEGGDPEMGYLLSCPSCIVGEGKED